MALMLPKFVVIRSDFSKVVCYMTEPEQQRGEVRNDGNDVFDPLAKIAVERAKSNSKFVHLRFCYSNKYWSLKPNEMYIVALSNQPDEDISKPSCTLFEPTSVSFKGTLGLRHVRSRKRVQAGSITQGQLCVGDGDDFRFLDWDTLVKLPKHVAFKGYNGKYLNSIWFQRHEYLQFSSDDANHVRTAYEVITLPQGWVHIMSKHYGKFWRRSPNWIWADSTNAVGSDELFWPVKINDNTIALRNAGNDRFCSSLTTERKTDCLNAAVSTITREARLQVEELVLESKVYDVVYRMENARIFDEKAFIAGTSTAVNNTQEKAHLTVKVSYEETKSSSFTNSLSIRSGFKTEIQTGIPFIVDGKIEISSEVTNSFQWNTKTTEKKTAEAAYEVVVPPMSSVKVEYIATKGTCDVPFSYTRKDKMSSDGSFVTTQEIDGIYTGVNYYNFHFNQASIN